MEKNENNVKMNEYSLSVIIPNYNNEKYIGKCIDSILRQTVLPDEIIIVDDCSTDSSAAIIRDYEKKHNIIKAIYLKQNRGVSYARNCGISAASSVYITCTDSDDIYYSKTKIENEMSLIKRYAEKNIDIVAYSPFVKINKEDDVVWYPNMKKHNSSNGWITTDLLSRNNSRNIPRDYCVKKKIIMDVGAYSFYKDFFEDFDLIIRLSQSVRFYSTYKYGIAYRMTPNGLSKRKKEEHIKTVNEIINNYYSKLSITKKTEVNVKRVYWIIKRILFLVIGQ